MKMKCPHCGVSGEADQAAAGRLTKCPRCTELFLIPDPTAAIQPAPPTPPEEADLDHLEPVFPEDETITDERKIFGGPIEDEEGDPFGEIALEPEEDQAGLDIPELPPVDDASEELEVPVAEEGDGELSDWSVTVDDTVEFSEDVVAAAAQLGEPPPVDDASEELEVPVAEEDDGELSDWSATVDDTMEIPEEVVEATDQLGEPPESIPEDSGSAEQIMQDISAEIDAEESPEEQILAVDQDDVVPLSEFDQPGSDTIELQEGGVVEEATGVAPSESTTYDSDGAEQIMLDIAAEIDADETAGGLDIELTPSDSESTDSWSQQFDEGEQVPDTGSVGAEAGEEGKEDIIGEEFFEFDAPSPDDFLDIADSETAPPESGATEQAGAAVEQSPDHQEYPDFSEDKVTWKQEGADSAAGDGPGADESIELDETPIPQPGEEKIQAELDELLTNPCLACDNMVEGDELYCPECIAKRGLDEEAEQPPEDSPDEPSSPDKKGRGGMSRQRILILCLLLTGLGAAGFFLLQQYGIL